jgi:ribosomal protein L23
LYLAARNLPHVDVIDTAAVDPVSLIAFEKLFMSVQRCQKIRGRTGMNNERCIPSNPVGAHTSLKKPNVSATSWAMQGFQGCVQMPPKLEIKKAVEQLFGVEVEAVNTVSIKGKTKRFGQDCWPSFRHQESIRHAQSRLVHVVAVTAEALKLSAGNKERIMPIVKCKPTSPGRRFVEKVVNPRSAQRSPFAAFG